MARNLSPRGRLERREQQDLSLFSGIVSRESKIRHEVQPGGVKGTRPTKLSEYGKQYRAKQLAKRLYGVLERQFRNYFIKASGMKGSTGTNLLILLECRLDNVIYCMGFSATRAEARQLISHKAILVNDQIVNIASYSVKPGDKIEIRQRARKQSRIKSAIDLSNNRTLPEWLEADHSKMEGVVKRLPDRDDISPAINELLIVELYSK
ncbi:MAG: 30S ribosomal protein S4 [Gammaproteobacteria bacterium]|nr:30S ribosomal protein S4 [Gammaproteobacteria bacterium]MCP4473873.1 30S ribosomal protein S4 [Gammaproteobacteria bacterium]